VTYEFSIRLGDTFPVGCAFDESNVHHKVHITQYILLVTQKY